MNLSTIPSNQQQLLALQGTQGVCPTGWVVPTAEDCLVLINEFGGVSKGGPYLKSFRYWDGPKEGNGGYEALPTGLSVNTGDLLYVGNATGWWTSTYLGFSLVAGGYIEDKAYQYSFMLSYGASIRCILSQE